MKTCVGCKKELPQERDVTYVPLHIKKVGLDIWILCVECAKPLLAILDKGERK